MDEMDERMNEEALDSPDGHVVDDGDGQLDRISALPDALLCHILSFLPDTKQCAANSILSTRWRYIMASLPDIVLHSVQPQEVRKHANGLDYIESHSSGYNFDDEDYRKISAFINFCNGVIMLRNGTPMRKLELSLICDEQFRVAFDSMLSAALSCKLQELHICVDSYRSRYYDYRFPPEAIFTCKTLVSLKLYWPKLELVVPNSVCLPKLKALNLKRLKLVDGDSFHRLLQGCPLLEQFYCSLWCLRNRDGGTKLEDLHISNPWMKKLTMQFWRGCGFNTIVVESNNLEIFYCRVINHVTITINAPNLKYLSCNGPVYGVNLIQSPKSLVIAELVIRWRFFEERSQDVFELLSRLQNVRSLCLTESVLMALHHLQIVPTLENLRRLEIEPFLDHFFDHKQSWKMIPRLLASAPNLEVLVFGQVIWNDWMGYKDVPELIPKGSIQHVKEIEFTRFLGGDHDIMLAEYLLENGKALKKMSLGGYTSLNGIMSLQRCSRDCQVVFARTEDMSKEHIYHLFHKS